jgi:hypothetical protein
MVWAAVAVGGASLLSGVLGSKASKSAASTQAGAAQYAADIANRQYQDTVARQAPFVQSGYGSLGALNYLLGIPNPSPYAPQPAGGPATYPQMTGAGSGTFGDMLGRSALTGPPTAGRPMQGRGAAWGVADVLNRSGALAPQGGMTAHGSAPAGGYATMPGRATWDQGLPFGSPDTGASPGGLPFGSLLKPFDVDTFRQMSPAYAFQRQQGMQGVVNGATDAQGALAGSTQKDLIDYNQALADTAFNTAFNQYQAQQGNIYQRLSNLAQLGQGAASNVASTGANLAGSAAQSVSNAGSALAAGQIGSANAITGGLSNAAPWLMAGLQGGGGGVPWGDVMNSVQLGGG